MQYPKPSYKRQRDKVQKIKFERGFCYNCHREYGLEPHHIYGGNPDRQHSDDYGLVVDLCHDCHLSVTDEKDQGLITRLQQDGQRRFEAIYGRNKFYEVFGRYYL
jgi:hypothetical protein